MNEIALLGTGSPQPQSLEKLSKEKQISVVSQQFESMLLRQMLGDALKPVFKSYLSTENSSNDIYRYFFVDAITQSLASTSPLQINKLLAANISSSPLDPNPKKMP